MLSDKTEYSRIICNLSASHEMLNDAVSNVNRYNWLSIPHQWKQLLLSTCTNSW